MKNIRKYKGEMVHMQENVKNEGVHKLKWFVSLPVIIIAIIVFFPIGILLFVLRCIFLLKDKMIYQRKRKVCNTWIMLGVSVLFIGFVILADKDADHNANNSANNNDITVTEQIDQAEKSDHNAEENTETAADEKKHMGESEKTTEIVTEYTKEKSTGEDCDPEIIRSSAKQYAYYENSYYLDAQQSFVDFLNECYKQTESGQQLEIISLDQILKEAGVSKSLRKKIAKADSQDVFKNSEFVRMDKKKDKKIFSSKPEYYEVSSKDKADIQDEQSVVFYLGKLKDNKPNGEGAFFSTTETGTRLVYAGELKDGRTQGKGVLFTNSEVGACVVYIGNFKEGSMNGKGTIYDSGSVTQTYNNYATEYNEIKSAYFDQYTAEQQNNITKDLLSYFPFLKLSVVYESYTANESLGVVKCNYPVIRPVIKYQGSLKNEKYDGKGTLYGGLSTLWYDGEFKNGKFHGKGTLYYATTGIPEYKGEFKDGKYNGKGTLYNDDGSVRKKGQFKKEEPDANQEMQEGFTISDLTDVETYFDKAIQKIIVKYNLDAQDDEDDSDDYYEEDEYSDDDYDEDDYEGDEAGDEESDEYEREYILPDSEEKSYTEEDLEEQQLSAEECRIARNEIYARHGRIFQDEELQKYFESMYWYELDEDFSEDELSDVERHNLEVITNYEKKMGYR